MMKNKLIPIILLCFLTACGSIDILDKTHNKETALPALASIGNYKETLLKKSFKHLGIPKLQNTIKLVVQEIPFNKQSYKEYKRFIKNSGKEQRIVYIDSLPIKPTYFKLSLADKVGMVSALNAEENSDLKNYIEKDVHNKIVTDISFIILGPRSRDFGKITEIHLVEQNHGVIALQIIRDDHTKDILNFNDFEIFNYEISSFCWEIDSRYHPKIAALVEGDPCPGSTHMDAAKAIEEREDLNF